ncbi:procollagen-lysine,2-oxoglutarate 5-dioxygenase 1-like isoform X1 [Rhopilema esculentum]|uniref:procollagen-lysine,2-oxoglutarate 5-dioxygenase 1-like isoform X1 n=1 Tax=Rhopilema esculentum TaxID=499914 RepID=UPI0031DE5FAC
MMNSLIFFAAVAFCLLTARQGEGKEDIKGLKLVVVTVATKETDGYKRFMRSCNLYGINVKVFGMNEQWRGGDIANGPGGGHKINILKNALKEYKDDNSTIVMFTDSYDVVFTAGADVILKKFLKFDANIVFSAEDFCWPDKSLASSYPAVPEGYKYLCSGGIIGYANNFNQLINFEKVGNTDDDQLYYTRIYLKHRDEFKIKLDHKGDIIQNLNGNSEDVELTFDSKDVKLTNTRFQTVPAVVHGNGPSKSILNHFGNYLAKSWTFDAGCMKCNENTFNLKDLKEQEYPKVLMSMFIERPTPFLPAYLERLAQLDYPKKKIDLFIHNIDTYHNDDVTAWLKTHNDEYSSVKYLGPHSFLKEYEARNKAMFHCKSVKCDYVFVVDADVTLTNKDTLRVLIEQNRTVLAPLVTIHERLWSNFWGAIGEDGYYARSDDYIDIVKYDRIGVWNVPFISKAYLIKSSVISDIKSNPFHSEFVDSDMKFCENLRSDGIFMYITNMVYFGHIKNVGNYRTDMKHNDMFELFDNRLDWENRYLHENYSKYLDVNQPVPEPCPDVYWFPFMSVNFTQDLIEEMEHFGKWSGGGNNPTKDERLNGGYENVPTVDIHMNQIGFEKHWLRILKDYIAPMTTRLYAGYFPDSRAIMNFVVKYTPNGQYFLRPHHDSSTFTINVALNRPGIDYEGGGSHFLRYNCTAPPSVRGWTLMHPGRLTHYHEGLPTTSGTRYILVSFIDP